MVRIIVLFCFTEYIFCSIFVIVKKLYKTIFFQKF